MSKAAGILFITPDQKVLFLKRGPGGTYPGFWAFPGGTLEGDETFEECAIREANEELGSFPDGVRRYWTRRVSEPNAQPILNAQPDQLAPSSVPPGDSVDFVTYLQRVEAEFTPKLNGEHTGYAWAKIDEPPEPLHPGCRVALDRFGMDETGVAKSIASGEMTSPQRIGNAWFFAMRFTGTGVAYRNKVSEYAFRDPAIYLNAAFLERCLGVPVIWQHPGKDVLNSEQFSERVVGSIVYAYIQGDEVWCVARIYDADAIDLLSNKQFSTSPAVVWADKSVNTKMELEDGSSLFIEGKPSFLDHLAICEAGVWDKGGPPAGVKSETIGDGKMADEKSEAKADEEKVRADANGEKLDMVLKHLDSLHKRMDGMEEERKADSKRLDSFEEEAKAMKSDKRKDSEEKEEKEEKKADSKRKDDDDMSMSDKSRKDSKRKDDDDGEEEGKAKEMAADKKRADAKRKDDEEEEMKADARLDSVATRIVDLEKRIPMDVNDQAYAAMADIQARYDSVAGAHGAEAPRPMQGETPRAYRNRLAGMFKKHSKRWSEISLSAMDDAAFNNAEADICSDALTAAENPVVPAGSLFQRVTKDQTGRSITSFYGSPRAWMSQFSSVPRAVTRIGLQKESN